MYDIIIMGGGPAGVAAGIYAKRAGMNAVIFEKMFIGGQIAITSELENYPGFGDPVTGADFALALFTQCNNIGVPIINEEITSVNLQDDIKKVTTEKGEYEAKAVIIATGASVRKLGLPEEDRYVGRGVSYCATCDGSFYKDKVVALQGGGNTAVTEAIYLSSIAKKVYVIHRRDIFRASSVLIDKMNSKENIEIIINSSVAKIIGDDKVRAVDIKNNITEEINQLDIDGLFVAIGRIPDTRFMDYEFMDERGYIKTDSDLNVGIKGVYAAGDVVVKKLRQVVTAVADGAVAATSAIEYVEQH